ncbi:hypothetical protein RYX45_11570 [Alkalihalophilus pseudofirmus]|uniref:Uncharacterized protein n=1 Tax=Alkalihalophilus pseudofirmus TaxID=79885 RepID=A0AAJ2NNT5_ALKPS|nr:hypothetical protein [Alkalihalophilus pseudofirmus]MDV2885820.1 hypothetical protein [Alkalihalophilus pseudofirmus]
MIELVDWLKKQYGFKQVEFINEVVILTDQGRKRIRSWSDSSLLDWHIKWRDNCIQTPLVLCDRMIRTKEEEASAKWRDQWITLHDELEEPYPQLGHEQAWGVLFGLMITNGIQTKGEQAVRSPADQKVEWKDDHWNPILLNGLRQDIQTHMRKYHKEALERIKKAKALSVKVSHIKKPVLDPIHTAKQARCIYDVLIWQGTNEEPELGYHSLRSFLLQWHKENGTNSLRDLIHSMGQTEGFTKDQALLLLQECLEPYEWASAANALMSNRSEREIEEKLTQMTLEWDAAKHLVVILARWIDEQKKVVI